MHAPPYVNDPQHEDLPIVRDTTALPFGANAAAPITASRDGDPFTVDFLDPNGAVIFTLTMEVSKGDYTITNIANHVVIDR